MKIPAKKAANENPTGRMGWMAHRKWKKIKLQPSMLPGPAVPGSCLASFHFRWAIHPIRPVLPPLAGGVSLVVFIMVISSEGVINESEN